MDETTIKIENFMKTFWLPRLAETLCKVNEMINNLDPVEDKEFILYLHQIRDFELQEHEFADEKYNILEKAMVLQKN